MVTVDVLQWQLGSAASSDWEALERALGVDEFAKLETALFCVLCEYFEGCPHCDFKQKSISPLGGGKGSFKRLKMRLRVPGCGKSGGPRLGVSVDCEAKVVQISGFYAGSGAATDEAMASDFAESE